MPRPRITEPFSGAPGRGMGGAVGGSPSESAGTGGSDGPVFDAGQRMLGPQETGCAFRPHNRLLFKEVPQGLTSAQRTCAGERQRQAGGYPRGGRGAWAWASRVAIKFSQLCSAPTRPGHVCRPSSAWLRSPRVPLARVQAASSRGPGSLCCHTLPAFPLLPAWPRAASSSGPSHQDETNGVSSCIYSRKINICFVRHLKWALFQ